MACPHKVCVKISLVNKYLFVHPGETGIVLVPLFDSLINYLQQRPAC